MCRTVRSSWQCGMWRLAGAGVRGHDGRSARTGERASRHVAVQLGHTNVNTHSLIQQQQQQQHSLDTRQHIQYFSAPHAPVGRAVSTLPRKPSAALDFLIFAVSAAPHTTTKATPNDCRAREDIFKCRTGALGAQDRARTADTSIPHIPIRARCEHTESGMASPSAPTPHGALDEPRSNIALMIHYRTSHNNESHAQRLPSARGHI